MYHSTARLLLGTGPPQCQLWDPNTELVTMLLNVKFPISLDHWDLYNTVCHSNRVVSDLVVIKLDNQRANISRWVSIHLGT